MNSEQPSFNIYHHTIIQHISLHTFKLR